MLVKYVSAVLIVVILNFVITVPAFTQTKLTKEEKKVAKIKEKLKKLGTGEKVKIKVELYNGTIYQGSLSESNENEFKVLDKSGTNNTVKYDDVKKIGGKNLSTGAKIAIGIGIGAGATLLTLYLIFLSITENN